MATKCFAKTIAGGCSALYVMHCDESKCPFYKSVEHAKADFRKAADRCRKLDIPANGEYILWKKAKDLEEQNR